MEIFGQVEKFLAELYPYRIPLSIAALLVVAAGVVVAYRMGTHNMLWRRKYWTASIGLPLLLVGVLVGNYLLSPLWTRTTLIEESPLAMSTNAEGASPEASPTVMEMAVGPTASPPAPATVVAEATAEPTAFVPRIVQEGEWVGADEFHFADGRALIIESEPGKFVLRVEDFSVRNGPDLFVVLSADPDGYSSENLNLGELRATDGAFNYDIPEGTDLSQFKSVVIWCERFAVLFGTATLM